MNKSRTSAFSLIEVVLAIGIFLVTVLALIGLIGPTLKAVDEVEKIDEITSIVNTLNAFLQSSPDIALIGETKFETIYNAVGTDQHVTAFIFRRYTTDQGTDVELAVGFLGETNAQLTVADFDNIAGPVYRAVISASSVTPEALLISPARNPTTGVYQLSELFANYPEGSLPLEIRIFDLQRDTQSAAPPTVEIPAATDLESLINIEPMFTYNTAIVR